MPISLLEDVYVTIRLLILRRKAPRSDIQFAGLQYARSYASHTLPNKNSEATNSAAV
jgi:hypothetical protein